jgi:hypothetical protein
MAIVTSGLAILFPMESRMVLNLFRQSCAASFASDRE